MNIVLNFIIHKTLQKIHLYLDYKVKTPNVFKNDSL